MPNNFETWVHGPPIEILKFGYNPDISTTTDPEDVWDGGGLYPFPSSANATTIVSDSANDTSAGTGARTVTIQGLDSSYNSIEETATMNGTTPVNLTNQFLRIHRAFVATRGTSDNNEGIIQIKHSSTVICQIAATYGQSLMAIYTVPLDTIDYGLITHFSAGLGKSTSAYAEVALETCEFGGAWRTRYLVFATNAARVIEDFHNPLQVQPRTDIRVRVNSVSANNVSIDASFDIRSFKLGRS